MGILTFGYSQSCTPQFCGTMRTRIKRQKELAWFGSFAKQRMLCLRAPNSLPAIQPGQPHSCLSWDISSSQQKFSQKVKGDLGNETVTGAFEKLQCLPGGVEGSTYTQSSTHTQGEPCYLVVLGRPCDSCLEKIYEEGEVSPTPPKDHLQKRVEGLLQVWEHKFLTTELC